MRKILLVITLFMSIFQYGQLDRSKQPEPGPAPEINLGDAQSFELKNGLKVLVVENKKLPRVRIELDIDNPPIREGNKAGVASLLGAMMGQGTTNISKDAYNEEVDFLGAFISFGSQGAYASSLSKYFPRILQLLADAAINPNFTQEEFEKETAKLITGLKSGEKDVAEVAGRVQAALAYGIDHPYGEFITEETVKNITLADIQDFYRNYFVPANAYLIIVGDVSFEDVKEKVTEAFTPWTKATPPTFQFSDPQDAQYTQINFVDMPNAVQSEISVQNLVNFSMKDEDYLPALIANQILGGGGEGRLFLNLREDKGYTYGSYSSLRNNKYETSRFNAYAQVRNAVTDSSVVEILKEIDKIRTEPVSEKELANTKAKYSGRFVMALESPETVADYALNIEKEGLPRDFYKTYLERINKVTVEEVQAAAQKHFNTDQARIVVVGKGSEVIENLEKVTFKGKTVPTLYYDKYAGKTEKPNYEAALPEGLNATAVLQTYIDAIGGSEKVNAVESYAFIAEAEAMGQTLEMVMKKNAGTQLLLDVKMGSNSMQKQVLDGDKGYAMAMGQKKELSPEEIEKLKSEATTFPEVNYLVAGEIKLDGVEMVGDRKAYKLKISEEKSVYYDTETGLKLQEVTTQEMQGQSMQVIITYDDYREVSGVKFPFKIGQSMGPMNLEFVVKDLRVNEGVSDADFD